MRYLKGLFGTWAGLSVGMLIIGVITGTVGRQVGDVYSFVMINLIFSFIGASLTYFMEKETWSWKNYATSGGIFTGGPIAIFFGLFVYSFVSAGLGGITAVELLLAFAYTMFSGACAGIGYMLLTRSNKASS